MQRFCFVHAADLHLDTPFQGVHALSPEIATALRDASLEAWDALVELTLEREAAFLLLAGDLYDGAERGLRAQLRFRKGLERLADAGISTLLVHGNHDPTGEGWSAIHSWPDRVTRFRADGVHSVGVEREGERIATVHGVSYPRREVRDNLALDFRRGPEPGLHIGLLHCNVGGSSDHANYSPCSMADLQRAGLDYWALGHIHQHRVLSREDPCIVYPGVLQGRRPKPSEMGAKGAVVVDVRDGRIDGLEFVAVDKVRFAGLELDLSGCSDLAQVESALGEAALRSREENGGRSLVLRARLTGRSELYADLERPGNLNELLSALRDANTGTPPFLWWESLKSRVSRPMDRDALLARSDFAGELASRADQLEADQDDLADFLDHELRSLKRRHRGVEVPGLAVEDHPELLREGEALAMELLSASTADGVE